MKKHVWLYVLALIVIPVSSQASTDAENKFQQDLIAGDAAAATTDLDALDHDTSIWNKPDPYLRIDGHKAVRFLNAADDFNHTMVKYDPKVATEMDLETVEGVYLDVKDAASNLTSDPLHFDQPTVDALNKRIADIRTTYNDYITAAKAAVEQRKQDEIDARKRQEDAEKAKEKADADAQARQEKREQLAEQAAIKKHKDQIALLDKMAKGKGYKGLYSSGIARFVYGKQKQGGIEQDVNYVFWRDISEDDKHRDSEFTMENIVSGYGIFTLSSCCDVRGNYISMTIAVPVGKSAINGQSLTDEYYVYSGNETFNTVTGTQMNVPVFKPVKLDK